MAELHDVVIIGAGLAGLAAARQLSIHGVDVVVVDSSDAVGGRVPVTLQGQITLDLKEFDVLGVRLQPAS